jgi:Acetyltransferase (GNAT) domain
VSCIYRISPLQDPRWDDLLSRHPDASVFHTRAWSEALRRTYDYSSWGFTTSHVGDALKNAVVLSKVKSWITGSRLVSVAFADACQPLVNSAQELEEIVGAIQKSCQEERYKYVEFRWITAGPVENATNGLNADTSYAYHTIDLRPELKAIFRSFHKSCIQRKIRRAETEQLEYEVGSSDDMLREFYRLLILTRRRHGVPPQPFVWFRNLRDCFGSNFQIRIAMKDRRPIASILTLQCKQRLVYKYGCSDVRFHHLGPMPWLFWQAIQEAKAQALDELDLGRSDTTDHGLIAFKNHLGASQSVLTNYRYPRKKATENSSTRRLKVKSFEYLPASVLRVAGSVLYRHMG